MSTHYAIENVVPHAGPMSLLRSIEDYGEIWLQARASIAADNLFLVRDHVPAWVGIEYMAQTIAAWAGVKACQQGDPIRAGFLVGTRQYRASHSEFRLGSELQITVQQEFMGDNGLAVFDCRIEGVDQRGSTFEASARLNVFQPQNINENLKEGP